MSFTVARSFTPAWSLALGLALSFYSTSLPAGAALFLALVLAGGATAWLQGFPGLAPKTRSRLSVIVLAFSLGLCAGASARVDESASPRPLPEARFVPPVPALQGAVALAPVGLSGKVAADSGPLRKGFRFYSVEVEEVVLAGPGLTARVVARGPLRIMTAEGPALLSGSRLVAKSGRLLPAAPGVEPLFLADEAGLLTTPPPGLPARVRGPLRSALISALDLAGGGGATSGLLEALLSGCRDGLDADEAADYRLAGCAAVLSLSGQHLSILAAAVALVLKPLGGPRRAKALSLVLAAFFVFVCGPEPALLRSLIMYGLAVATTLADKPQTGRNILGLSFVLQLALDPGSARGLSFELSYLALAGLVVLSPRFERLLVPFMPPFLATAFAASFAAQAATTPLCVMVFGAIYPVGLVASVASAPLVAAFIWWGLGSALACGLVPALSLWAAPVSRFLHDSLAAMMAWFAAWPALLPQEGDKGLAAASVVLVAAFVYALPHAEHALGLRFAPRPEVPSRVRGTRDVQTLRPELPREPERPPAHP